MDEVIPKPASLEVIKNVIEETIQYKGSQSSNKNL